ncbi:BRCA2 and CDKN1A-interacting protein isoform X2 [Erinaceus europaeus]|uniref:BRCA2 and CDKN1A-interacting protein n=1 Tax=Erinaceus europaeus TaxID=9365 RepID=A0A1S3WC61_ERIEU|nr:BRCA2 and CDKN1A-interacting protein isoform X2 [Erinaceus europaeus]
MASRPKRRAVGDGVPEPPGAPAQRPEDEDEGDDGVEDEGSEDDASDRDDEDEDEDAALVGEEVTVDFEAFAIADGDYDGLFLKAPVDTAELAALLVQQKHVGSVIKQTAASGDSDSDGDVEDEVFGFISLLNLTERKGTACAEQIKELIVSACEKSCERGTAERLTELLSDPGRPVGLLLSERFVNVPPQVALPMHQQLQKELAEARRANKPCGRCCSFLLISKTFVEAGKRQPATKGGSQEAERLLFANAEEEFFYEAASLRFSYSVQDDSAECLAGRWAFEDAPLRPQRTVMLVPGASMDGVMEKLREHLSV